jgi:hypothetical protein
MWDKNPLQLTEVIRNHSQRGVAYLHARGWLAPQSWPLWVGVVTLLLFVIGLARGGAGDSLVTVGGTVGGVALAFWLNSRERRQEDERRRRALATALLAEIHLLKLSLQSIHETEDAGNRRIEPFQTAVYDTIGANLVLFNRETVQALIVFYHMIHELQSTLTRTEAQHRDPTHEVHGVVRLMATPAVDAEPDLTRRLRDEEGGQELGPLPVLRFHRIGQRLDAADLRPSASQRPEVQ